MNATNEIFRDSLYETYEQSDVVTSMTSLPRFGHTKDFAALVSLDESSLNSTEITSVLTASVGDVKKLTSVGGSGSGGASSSSSSLGLSDPLSDYAQGMQFIFFMILIPFVFWSFVLLLFKLYHFVFQLINKRKTTNNVVRIFSGTVPLTNDGTTTTTPPISTRTFNVDVVKDPTDYTTTEDHADVHHHHHHSGGVEYHGTALQVHKQKAEQKHMMAIRTIFIVAACLLIVFATLLISKGSSSVNGTKKLVSEATHDVSYMIDEALHAVNSMSYVGQIGFAFKYQLIRDLRDPEKLCPADTSLLNDQNGGNQLLQLSTEVRDLLGNIGDFNQSEVDRLHDAFTELKSHNDQITDVVESFEDPSSVMFFFTSAPLILIASIMIISTFAAHWNLMGKDAYRYYIPQLLDLVLLPIFIFIIHLAFVVCAITSILAVANADFCVEATSNALVPSARNSSTYLDIKDAVSSFTMNSTRVNSQIDRHYSYLPKPDAVMQLLMDRSNYTQDDFPYQVVNYFVHQCTNEAKTDPFVKLRQYNREMEASEAKLASLVTAINNSTLALQCNTDFELKSDLVQKMDTIFLSLQQTSKRALNLFDCNHVVPMYTNTMYDGICSHNVSAIVWIYSCLLIVSFCGMIMITLRVSYQNGVDDDHRNNTDNDNAKELLSTTFNTNDDDNNIHKNNPAVVSLAAAAAQEEQQQLNNEQFDDEQQDNERVGNKRMSSSRRSQKKKQSTDLKIESTISSQHKIEEDITNIEMEQLTSEAFNDNDNHDDNDNERDMIDVI